MSIVAEQCEWMNSTRVLSPAQVLAVDPAQRRVRLRLAGSDDGIGLWARIAIPGAVELKTDDTILVIGDEPDELYAIGLLNRKAAPARVALSSGAYAEAAWTQANETLRVYSPNNELLFEYDQARGKARINVEKGNLEFATPDGSIVFASGREILFHGRSVGISAMSEVRLETAPAIGGSGSAVTLLPDRADLTSRDLRLAAERLETAAHSIVEKAKNVYRTVEQLTQLRTGRLRTLVSSTFHFKARRAFVKSEQDYRIKAEKIHLG